MNTDIYNIADYIIQKLTEKNIIIQRYDSMKTSSVYLKLDYGVCNSIRISNHTGKQHLQYRYNLIIDCEPQSTTDSYPRYYFNQHGIDDMLQFILKERQQKISKYGYTNYKTFMKNNQQTHKKDKQGFWRQAKLVTKS